MENLRRCKSILASCDKFCLGKFVNTSLDENTKDFMHVQELIQSAKEFQRGGNDWSRKRFFKTGAKVMKDNFIVVDNRTLEDYRVSIELLKLVYYQPTPTFCFGIISKRIWSVSYYMYYIKLYVLQ